MTTARRAFLLAAATASMGLTVAARAQVSGSWVGASLGSWSVPTNWSSNPGVPNNGGYAMFAGYTANVVQDVSTLNLNGLSFDSRGDYTISNAGFQLRSFGSTLSIDTPSSRLNKPGGTVYVGHQITAALASGSGQVSIIKTGPGLLTLNPSASNSIADVRVSGGTLGFNGNGSTLGTGPITLDGGALRVGTGSLTSGSVNGSIICGPGGGTLDNEVFTTICFGTFASVSGPGTFTRVGTGSVVFNLPLAQLGPTYILGGGTAQTILSNTSAITGSSTITVSGTLKVLSGNIDRLNDNAPLVLRGGTLDTVSTGSNEQTGTLILGGGQNVISIESSPRAIIANGVQRDDRATLLVRGTGLGTNTHFYNGTGGVPSAVSPFPLVGGGGAAGTPYVSIIPYAFTDGAFPSTVQSFLTYDSSAGVRPLDQNTEYVTTIPAADPTANVRLTGSMFVPAGGATVNAIMSTNSSSVFGPNPITVTSGAMWGVNMLANVELGAAEGFFSNGTLAGSVSGTNGITLNGAVNLFDHSSTYTGQTTINSGTATFQFPGGGTIVAGQPEVFGADTSPIVLMGRGIGATLTSIGTGTLTRDITVRSDPDLNSAFLPALRGGFTHTGNLNLEGPLFVDSSMKLLGTISGAGRLVGPSIAGGSITLGGNNTFTGGVDISTGTFAAASDTAFGTGTIYVGDGPVSGSGTVGTIIPAGNAGQGFASHTFSNAFLLLDNLTFFSPTNSTTVTLNGPIDLNGEARSLRANGAFPPAGSFSVVSNGTISGGELRTQGVIELNGSNSQWATRIDDGRLRITNSNALGNAPRSTQIGSGGQVGSNGATLEMIGGLTIPSNPLTFNATYPVTLRSLSGANVWSGGATIMGQGTFQVDADTLAVNGGINAVTVGGNNIIWKTGTATLQTKFVRTPNELRVSTGLVQIIPDGSSSATSNVAALTIAGATDAWTSTLDLTNNDLVLATGALGVAETNLANQLKSGYAGGAWNGAGIDSSSAAADPNTALGWARATDLFNSFPAIFSGQSVNNTALLVRYTTQGDANLDGTTDTLDFNLMVSNFGTTGQRWFSGDFNYDGSVDTVDFNSLVSAFGQVVPAEALAPSTSLVPEPASGLGVLALAAGRRYRRARPRSTPRATELISVV